MLLVTLWVCCTLSCVIFTPKGLEFSDYYIANQRLVLNVGTNTNTSFSIAVEGEHVDGSIMSFRIDVSLSAQLTLSTDSGLPFIDRSVKGFDDPYCGATIVSTICTGRKTLCCYDVTRGRNTAYCCLPTGSAYETFYLRNVTNTCIAHVTISANDEAQGAYRQALSFEQPSVVAEFQNKTFSILLEGHSVADEVWGLLNRSVFLSNGTQDPLSIDNVTVFLGDLKTNDILCDDEWIGQTDCVQTPYDREKESPLQYVEKLTNYLPASSFLYTDNGAFYFALYQPVYLSFEVAMNEQQE